jgi:protein required for attachment to host cells
VLLRFKRKLSAAVCLRVPIEPCLALDHGNLRRLALEWHDNPPTRDQGTDAPGRAFATIGERRSTVETTDWHQIEESRFAATIAAKINDSARLRQFKQLLIVALPKTLAELRRRLSERTRRCLAGEVD